MGILIVKKGTMCYYNDENYVSIQSWEEIIMTDKYNLNIKSVSLTNNTNQNSTVMASGVNACIQIPSYGNINNPITMHNHTGCTLKTMICKTGN